MPIRPMPNLLARHTSKFRKQLLSGKLPPLSQLQLNWKTIIGVKLSGLCWPVHIKNQKSGAILTLIVTPAAASMVQHFENEIMDRITASFGKITKLILRQGQIPTIKPKTAGLKSATPSISRTNYDKHLQSLPETRNPRLKENLARLAAMIDAKSVID